MQEEAASEVRALQELASQLQLEQEWAVQVTREVNSEEGLSAE